MKLTHQPYNRHNRHNTNKPRNRHNRHNLPYYAARTLNAAISVAFVAYSTLTVAIARASSTAAHSAPALTADHLIYAVPAIVGIYVIGALFIDDTHRGDSADNLQLGVDHVNPGS